MKNDFVIPERTSVIMTKKDLRKISKKSNHGFCEKECCICGGTFEADRKFIYCWSADKAPVCYECVEATITELLVFGFYLRFCSEHFIPCLKCQRELGKKIYESTRLILGNSAYTPLIELSRKWLIQDEESGKLV